MPPQCEATYDREATYDSGGITVRCLLNDNHIGPHIDADAYWPAPNPYGAEIGASSERYPRGWTPDDEKRG